MEPAGVPPSKLKFLVRQMLDHDTGNFTILVADMGCPGHPAALIDPLETTVKRDVQLIKELGVKLVYIMGTHFPVGHMSGAPLLKKQFPEAKTVISEASGAHADILVKGGDTIHVGNLGLEVRSTPGHTKGCVTYVTTEGPFYTRFAFTGHSIVIRGCGRTDIEGGDAEELFKSVHTQIFSLHKNTHILPGFDYNRNGHNVSCVREEMAHNPFFQK